VIDELSHNIKAKGSQSFLCYKDKKLELSSQDNEWCHLRVDETDEEFERLDTTEIVNLTKMLEVNRDKADKQLTKDMIVDCPELNFYADQILNGTMHQVRNDL